MTVKVQHIQFADSAKERCYCHEPCQSLSSGLCWGPSSPVMGNGLVLLPASARGPRGGCRALPGSSRRSRCLSTVYFVTLMHVEATAGSVVLTNRTAPGAASNSNRWVGICRVPPATSRAGRSGQPAVEGDCCPLPGRARALEGWDRGAAPASLSGRLSVG